MSSEVDRERYREMVGHTLRKYFDTSNKVCSLIYIALHDYCIKLYSLNW